MNMSAELRMPAWKLVVWYSDRRGEDRTADDGIPDETLGNMNVVPLHLGEALLLWEWIRACMVGEEQWFSIPIKAHAFLFVPWTAMGISSAEKMSLPSTSTVWHWSTRGTGWDWRQRYLQGVTLIGTDDPIRGRAILINVLQKVITLFIVLFHHGLEGFEV